MPSSSRPDRTSEDSTYTAERGKAFIDAVVAIAMTLLILPLMEAASELGTGELTSAEWFHEHTNQIVTFAISFVIIGRQWLGNHRLFSRVRRVTDTLLWLAIGWLITIVWLPVATALTGQAPRGDRMILVVYVGSMLAASVLALFIELYLARRPDLHEASGTELREGVTDALSTIVLFAAAAVIAVAIPDVGYYSLFAMALGSAVRRLIVPLLHQWHPSDGTAELARGE